jgi:hypothetical protein
MKSDDIFFVGDELADGLKQEQQKCSPSCPADAVGGLRPLNYVASAARVRGTSSLSAS